MLLRNNPKQTPEAASAPFRQFKNCGGYVPAVHSPQANVQDEHTDNRRDRSAVRCILVIYYHATRKVKKKIKNNGQKRSPECYPVPTDQSGCRRGQRPSLKDGGGGDTETSGFNL
jgi:hypothetical protein